MMELNRQVKQCEQLVPASGQLDVLSNGWDRPMRPYASGGRLMIGSKTYDQGLYCIAPSRIVVRLPSEGEGFEAVVGVDVNQKNQGWRRPLPVFQGQVFFSVTVDGRPVFKSSELSRQSEGVPVRVDLAGARKFTIDVAATGSISHIAWSDRAEAVVTLTDGRQLPLAKMVVKQPDERWKRVDAVIEWGFQEGFENRAYDGRVQVTSDSGKAGVVEPLPGGTAVTGANSWRSPPSGTERRGIVAPLLFSDAVRGPKRTIVTVRTVSGSFSFQPIDLAGGPILVPELGFFVADAATRTTAREFCALTGAWQPLAIEADRIILALDQMGMHRIARDCLTLWLENQKADGRLTLNTRAEGKHQIGQLSLPWVMAEHYRLTGDKEWLKAQAPRLKAAADWIAARRRTTMKNSLTPEEQRQIKCGQRSPSGPKSAPIHGVTVNGPSTTSTGSGQAGSGEAKPWTEFNKDKETITLKGLTGKVAVTAKY